MIQATQEIQKTYIEGKILNSILINGDVIQVNNWRLESKQVSDSLRQLMDSNEVISAERAFETILRLGSEVLKFSSNSLELERMTSVTQALTKHLEENSKETISVIDSAVQRLVDPKEGVIIKAANETIERTREAIGSLFVGDNALVPSEVVRKVNDKLENFAKEMHRVISQASINIGGNLSLDSEKSPLRALKVDIFQATQEMNRSIGDRLEDLRLKLEALDARKIVISNSTKKGIPFEEAVYEVCAQLSTASGDEAVHTGASVGTIKNCKKGDFTILINKQLTKGQSVKIVVETKSMELSREEWRKELNTAILNRGADVAVAVVERVEQMPNKSRINLADTNQLFVAFDPANDDPAVLMCILNYARAVAVSKKLQGQSLDQKVFSEVSEQLHSAISNLDGIEGAVKSARSSLDKIESARISIKTTVEFQVHRLAKVVEMGDSQVA